ncbi:MAG: hypothetical protein ACLQVD_12390 [Capsulimonadaceae bacterium]
MGQQRLRPQKTSRAPAVVQVGLTSPPKANDVVSVSGATLSDAEKKYLDDLAEYDKTIRAEYARYTSHLWQQRQDSESDSDKLVLSLSTAILGLSATFIKDIVPYVYVWSLELLVAAWAALGASVISTLVSYQVGRRSIDEHIEASSSYFFENHKDAFDDVSRTKKSTERINNCSSASFVLGLILILSFAGVNLKEVRRNMARQQQTTDNETHLVRSTTPPPAPKLPSRPSSPSSNVQTPQQPPPSAPAVGGNTTGAT